MNEDHFDHQASGAASTESARLGHSGRLHAGQDPLGKRALYSRSAESRGSWGPEPVESPKSGSGRISVTCSACDAVTRIGFFDFILLQLPVGIWIPRGAFDHWMTCPSCRRRVWAGVTLRRG